MRFLLPRHEKHGVHFAEGFLLVGKPERFAEEVLLAVTRSVRSDWPEQAVKTGLLCGIAPVRLGLMLAERHPRLGRSG